MLARIFFLLICMLLSHWSMAYQLKGVIRDEKGLPVPYVTVYKQNTSLASISNIKGEYAIELPSGNHTIVFQALGYVKQNATVEISNHDVVKNIRLEENITQLREVNINVDDHDKAARIIKKAIDVKEKYRRPADTYSCTAYIKAAVEKEYLKKDTSENAVLPEVITIEQMNFIESVSEYYISGSNKSKEIKIAYHDFAERFSSENSVSASVSFDNNVGPQQQVNINRDLFKTNLDEAEFNFTYNLISVPILGPQPFVSPISSGAMLSYKYTFEESFLEDGLWINKIKVIPRRKDAALFSGDIYIVEGSWNIKALNLQADKSNLHYYKYFNISQKYKQTNDSVWVLDEETFSYNSKLGKVTVYGSTYIDYKNYDLSPKLDKKFFNNELSVIKDDAYEKDSSYWALERTATLSEEELKFIHIQDSIENYHESDEYKNLRDSIVNEFHWTEVLFGSTFRNHKKGTSYYIPGLINSANPFGVGGFRARPEPRYNKEFKRGYELNISGMLNYGFTNKDIKGYARIGYKYAPKRFGRLYASYADEYGFLNSYESISRTFSMSNYVNEISYGVGHEIEIVNGLYLDVFAELVKKRPINNIQFSKWSQEVFGADNTVTEFEPTNLVLADINIKYTIKQKYRIEPYTKINLGSKYPTFVLTYRKGISGIYNSVANFDFVQLQVKDEIKLGTAGVSKWNVYTGKYLNNTSILLTENKFFRGSDPFFFSDPLKSFQLLGPSLNTNNEFLQAHYLHRFNGSILNKVPLIKKLHLLEVGGAGTLLIKDDNFKHVEVFAGLEKVFKIRRQQFKIGAYYVVSDDNISSLNGELKFGIDFFNSFTNSWSY